MSLPRNVLMHRGYYYIVNNLGNMVFYTSDGRYRSVTWGGQTTFDHYIGARSPLSVIDEIAHGSAIQEYRGVRYIENTGPDGETVVSFVDENGGPFVRRVQRSNATDYIIWDQHPHRFIDLMLDDTQDFLDAHV